MSSSVASLSRQVATAHRSFKIARPLSLIQTGDILEFRYIMLKQKGSFIAYNKSR